MRYKAGFQQRAGDSQDGIRTSTRKFAGSRTLAENAAIGGGGRGQGKAAGAESTKVESAAVNFADADLEGLGDPAVWAASFWRQTFCGPQRADGAMNHAVSPVRKGSIRLHLLEVEPSCSSVFSE